jgi:hypothetical protein
MIPCIQVTANQQSQRMSSVRRSQVVRWDSVAEKQSVKNTFFLWGSKLVPVHHQTSAGGSKSVLSECIAKKAQETTDHGRNWH